MKTSNIIVTSLIASITLIITTGMMEFRIKGVPRESIIRKPLEQLEIKQASVPEFQFVVIKDCGNATLETSDAFMVEMPDLPDGVSSPTYRVQNDTLYVNGFVNPDRVDFVVVKAPAQQIKWVGALHSTIVVNNVSFEQFVIRSDNSRISINAQNTINTLTIDGVNGSNIDFPQTMPINTLYLNLDRSEIYTTGSLGKLKGSIKNQSRAQLKQVNELAFTKDSTSRLLMWGDD